MQVIFDSFVELGYNFIQVIRLRLENSNGLVEMTIEGIYITHLTSRLVPYVVEPGYYSRRCIWVVVRRQRYWLWRRGDAVDEVLKLFEIRVVLHPQRCTRQFRFLLLRLLHLRLLHLRLLRLRLMRLRLLRLPMHLLPMHLLPLHLHLLLLR